MKFKSFFLLLMALTLTALSLSAQGRTEDEAREELDYYRSTRDSDQGNFGAGSLWYGGGFQLGFSSNSFESIFQIGLSPMVGYKVTPWFSVGPRGSILYNAYSFDVGNDRENSNFFTYSGGVFARAKAFQQFFAHAEYNLENDVIGLNPTTFDPIRRTRGVPYIGAGFVQGGGGFQGGGGVGFEIMILFPLVEREFINDSPYIIRSGINVNF
ncbi:MAG: hypothetical protein AAF433_16660 [Bacteroidota bacterium]